MLKYVRRYRAAGIALCGLASLAAAAIVLAVPHYADAAPFLQATPSPTPGTYGPIITAAPLSPEDAQATTAARTATAKTPTPEAMTAVPTTPTSTSGAATRRGPRRRLRGSCSTTRRKLARGPCTSAVAEPR